MVTPLSSFFQLKEKNQNFLKEKIKSFLQNAQAKKIF